ncbi:Pentatricopeptide repeat-containing protein [Nymphaea thermarum]|nr:Pentatricopeptide repeat-containing protein [Nymphaea thermarum]
MHFPCRVSLRTRALKLIANQHPERPSFSPFSTGCTTKLVSPVNRPLLDRFSTLKVPPCSGSAKVVQLKQIHAQIITSGLPLHKLFPFCVESGNIHYARIAFDRSRVLCKFDRNAMLQAYSKSAVPERALLLFREMLAVGDHDSGPDKYSFTFLIAACSRLDRSCNCHSMVVKKGFERDTFVKNSLVSMYVSFGAMEDARKLFDGMTEPRDVVLRTTMVGGYMKFGMVGLALELFDEMPDSNDVTWGVVIAGCVKNGRYKDALSIFYDMLQGTNVKPNEASLVCALSACAHLGALDQGKWIHVYVDKRGVICSSNLATALIDMYMKCGSITHARRVFNSVSSRKDLLSWTSMITGLALHGLGREAVDLFLHMLDIGMKPDHITLIGVLNACSHSGLVDQGRQFFHGMHQLWGIVPTLEHYGCIVDLLGRAGFIDEAVKIAKCMPVEPDIVIWRALLSACRIHGNLALAEEIMHHVDRCDPLDHGGSKILLSSMYASSNCWDGVARVRRTMCKQRIQLVPGWSSIEVKGVIHEFVAGDRTHSRSADIYQKLDEIFNRLQAVGYSPSTLRISFELSEEDKEQAMYWHSEKLAVAFGLLSTEDGFPIRVVKNLRICEDCHSAMKAISRVFGREIIVRDRSRFHNFKQGSCSCGDYW